MRELLFYLIFAVVVFIAAAVFWDFALRLFRRHCHKVRFHYKVGPVTLKRRETTMPLEVETTVEEQILITVNPTTSGGRPAEIDGPIRVSVISGDGTFEVQPDGKSYQSITPDTPGDTTLLIEADADLGAGVVLIQDTTIHHARGALAANLGQTAGAITPKP